MIKCHKDVYLNYALVEKIWVWYLLYQLLCFIGPYKGDCPISGGFLVEFELCVISYTRGKTTLWILFLSSVSFLHYKYSANCGCFTDEYVCCWSF